MLGLTNALFYKLNNILRLSIFFLGSFEVIFQMFQKPKNSIQNGKLILHFDCGDARDLTGGISPISGRTPALENHLPPISPQNRRQPSGLPTAYPRDLFSIKICTTRRAVSIFRWTFLATNRTFYLIFYCDCFIYVFVMAIYSFQPQDDD